MSGEHTDNAPIGEMIRARATIFEANFGPTIHRELVLNTMVPAGQAGPVPSRLTARLLRASCAALGEAAYHVSAMNKVEAA